MTSLREIIQHLESIAPNEFTVNGFENRLEIGPQYEDEQLKTTVNRVLLAVYPSARIVTKAAHEKMNLLITHRPLFPWAIDRLGGLDLVRVRLLVKNYVSTFVLGSPWIAAKDGLTDALVETLGLTLTRKFEVVGDFVQRVPLGRICKPKETMNHSKFANSLVNKLGLENVLFTGDLDAIVEKTLVVAGSILDISEVIEARKQGISTIVTGELAPSIRLLAGEEGINIYELGAFVTEEIGMKRLGTYLSLQFPELRIEYMRTNPVTKNLRPYTNVPR